MKQNKKIVSLVLVIFILFGKAFALENGFIWAMRANFNGAATLPSISKGDLERLGAAYMKGGIGYSMDGEAEIGYLFGSKRWFNMAADTFSGMSLYGTIGVGNGYTGEIAGNTIEGVTANVYINLYYTPIVSLGVGTKAYFLNGRLACGLWLGTKLVADLDPEYIAYSDEDSLNKVLGPGYIIVDDFMIKHMNPCSFSTKMVVEYNQPLLEHIETTIGGYFRFNLWKPGYITMPPVLMNAMNDALEKNGKPKFDTTTPLKSFFLNSLDFGLSLGVIFKG